MPARKLDEYARKRDFQATPEPASDSVPGTVGPLTFVVHRHAARRLHYDLRLELDGVLMSWAIPRGPSDRPGERRLAVRTEDHPIAYGSFEGIIPEKQYGAGTSIVWDAGTYSPDEPELLFRDRQAAENAVRIGLQAGKLSLTFRGAKLKGSWALVQTKTDWLLLKHRDAAAGRVDLAALAGSVYSGRTNVELESGVPWEPPGTPAHFSPSSLDDARTGAIIDLRPMLASGGRPIPTSNWAYEPKLDGIRVLGYIDGRRVRLVSRGGVDITDAYPAVASAVAAQPANSLVLDGEIIAIDEAGRPSFELLQRRINLKSPADVASSEASIPTQYLVFDVLHADGWDVTRAPYWQRRQLLERVVRPGPDLQAISAIELPPDAAFTTAVELGFEGIVAKRLDGRYEPGRRSQTWRKRKALERGAFVVAGWTPGEGSRSNAFGGLILGERRDDGTLVYRGRVGSGFADRDLRELVERLNAERTPNSPFAVATPESQEAHWVRPVVEVNVEYAEVTSAGMLRSPVFLGVADNFPAAGGAPPGGTLVAELERLGRRGTLTGDGWVLAVTNLDKVMWPASGAGGALSKLDLLRYAIQVWPWVAPHLRDRLITLTRFPNGIGGKRFYQRHWDTARPGFVQTVRVYSEGDGVDKDFILCNNLPTLLWLCQLADLEWHVSLARTTPLDDASVEPEFSGSSEVLDASPLNFPDALLFDFDPYIYRGDETPRMEPQPNSEGFAAAKEAALALRSLLAELSMPAFVKSSGATGLHVFVPLRRTLDFDGVSAVAVTLASELVRRHPRLVTTEWATGKRRGKVFIDAHQNARHKAIAAPFSPRAHLGGPVSMPVSWNALPTLRLGAHTIRNAVATLRTGRDPWRGMEAASVDLHQLLA